ncbi:hypothetical protein F2P56_007746 [Juglans regia]|uniref:Reverse transcriptase domain-containing protein n=2 Tax=Juglans regia TaxID=51240 RepID=A0A834D4N4_JUGRE|nr:uncharacterized protein LOC109002966 [Juglans regia]KAF5475998.1 hypothetical protein F2P56_007746 [Juglans regia]
MLFVDDSLIFYTADVEINHRLLELLKTYGDASGQLINQDKTVMVFSQNTEVANKRAIMELWGNSQVQHYDKYLGLPPLIGKSKMTAFVEIKHKVWMKLQGWKGNIFSRGGRRNDDKLLIGTKGGGNVHWVSWHSMCKPKVVGGLGFKDLETFNMDMLAKQSWRLLQYKDGLFYKVYIARYFSNSTLFEAPLDSSPSFAWRMIWEAKNLLIKGFQQQATVKNMNYRWSPPPPSWFKLNVDGALLFDCNKTGIGAIL